MMNVPRLRAELHRIREARVGKVRLAGARGRLLRQSVHGDVSKSFDVALRSSCVVVRGHFLERGRTGRSSPLMEEVPDNRPVGAG